MWTLTDPARQRIEPIGSWCEACGSRQKAGQTFHLTTRQVVMSEAYWAKTLTGVRNALVRLGLDVSVVDFSEVRDQYVANIARQPSAWSVCRGCTRMFDFDHATARIHALEGTSPPGCGEVPLDECAPIAARVWRRLVRD